MSITGHTTVLRSSLIGVSSGCSHISFTSQWLSRNTSTFPAETQAHMTQRFHGNMKYTGTHASFYQQQSIGSILTTLCHRRETPFTPKRVYKLENPQGLVQLQKVDSGYSHLARNAQVGTFLWEGFIVKYSTQTQQSCCNLNETSSDHSLGVRRCICPDTQHLPLWGRLQR